MKRKIAIRIAMLLISFSLFTKPLYAQYDGGYTSDTPYSDAPYHNSTYPDVTYPNAVYPCKDTITGNVFIDLNGNQIRDGAEVGKSGVTMLLSGDTSRTDVTGTGPIGIDPGNYAFFDVPDGAYIVTLDTATIPGYTVTTPNPATGINVCPPPAPVRNFALRINPPSGLTASCPSPGTTASLDWADSAAATFYLLRVDDTINAWNGACDGINDLPGDICEILTTSSRVFSSTPSHTYIWWVHSSNAAGNSGSTFGPSFTCALPPPPPAPTVTVLDSCINPGHDGSRISISWSNPGVTFVDIDTDPIFATPFFNKGVSASPTNGTGFNSWPTPGTILTYNPSTTYHVRTFNGTQNSLTASFTTPAACPPPVSSWIRTTGGSVFSNQDIVTPGGP